MKISKSKRVLCEIILLSTLLCSCHEMSPIEDLGILLGVGYDIELDDNVVYVDPAETPIVDGQKSPSSVYVGKGNTIYSLVENRMTKMSTKFTIGTELISIISEERARFGIEDIIDDILRNPKSNLNSLIAVNKGRCEDYFTIDNKTGESNSKTLYDLLRFSSLANFFPHNITVAEFFQMYYQEGRKIYLPYIELINEKPQITGVALFNKDKMVIKTPIEETKLLNLLRSDHGKGYLHISAENDLEFFDLDSFADYSSIISHSPLKYMDIYGDSKRKVKVSMVDNRLKYDITVSLTGDIVVNTIIQQSLDKNTIHLIENVLTKKLEKELKDEVIKIQKIYQEDFMDLGKYAVAKYGRQSKYGSNEYFLNAIINIKVSFTINSVGRNSKL